ncbi:MAG: T9SS type A sorting domain-containing protein [Bacteroidetes bacterium]|nr:T9SS type A sorting domain-containing protein [Bacteroidota bacterium]
MDTKGKDFWLTFLPNFHNNKNKADDRLRLGDSLYIFITSDEPTNGIIEYIDLLGNKYDKNFSITDTSEIYIFKVCYLDYELLGHNDSGLLNSRNNSENVKKQYFHVTSEKEITVYAHSQANKSSDACIVLPSDILGKDYFVMSYKSDGEYGIVLDGSSTPSQFVILGTQENTSVVIIPSDETQYNGKRTQTIILNSGDAYLVQANIEQGKLNTDLTGTEIHSDKPVAVFAGHQRSHLPVTTSIQNPSRDILFEQMPPIETWGKNALLVPYVQPAGITNQGTDLFRVLSAYNNTDIYINGVLIDRLNKGEFYEGQLVEPGLVEASAPVLIAQFKKTSGIGTNMGDPFEMLIPPIGQFMNFYRVINTQSFEYNERGYYQKAYSLQYITVVAPNSVVNSVFLDGSAIPGNRFINIPASTFSYANVSVTDGVHTISSNEKIGVYVYGYGAANSYGYVGGMYLRALDFQPPSIVGEDSCTSVLGMVYDTLIADSKIKKVTSPAESQKNVLVSIENFIPYKNAVSFKAELVDYLKDGEFEIEATDSMGFITKQKFTIHGFTVEFPGLTSKKPSIMFDSTIIGNLNCDSVEIKNTGVIPLSFDNNIYLKNNNIFSIPVSQLPLIIQPGESKMLKLCFSPRIVKNTRYVDTLFLVYNCIPLKIVLEGIAKPRIEEANSTCNIPLKLSVVNLPGNNYLRQNFPNPASDKTIIGFGNSATGFVSLKVYDLFGNLRMTVFNEELKQGVYEVQINIGNLEQGLYFYSLITGKNILSKTMLIRK